MDPLTFTRNYDPLQDVTYSCVDASARLALATTRTAITPRLRSYWSAKHFNPSLSPRP